MSVKCTARRGNHEEQPLRSRCSNCYTSVSSKSAGNPIQLSQSDDVRVYGKKIGLKWKEKHPSNLGFRLANGKSKFGWVRGLVSKEKPSFLAIQETKLNSVNASWVFSLWGSSDCNFVQKEKVGLSGGQLLIWDTNKFEALDVFNFDSVVGVRGKWRMDCSFLVVFNIYGPHDDSKKHQLCDRLLCCANKFTNEACLFCGDYNEVRSIDERLNCEFNIARSKRFNEFISESGLLEVPLGGRLFTRVSDDGLKFSKLDRFLVSGPLLDKWRDLSAVALDRKHFDHCPIMLCEVEKNYGPKPFKIFDVWFDEDDVDQVVSNAWMEAVPNNWRKDCFFRNKLKKVKDALRVWSRKKFGQIDGEIEMLKQAANGFECKAECGGLSDNEKLTWFKCRNL
ncbi:uncharacterized protein [Rutidosis leptorrhynchoides]|uniref:uncharacterized protein n=1 Tax=Rutidosis leptorrhynchoides TaxID=125765 RepID=UPI003A99620D